MSEKLEKVVTPDDMMEEFVTDMVIADDELSDSIFTCVDNFIDDLCIKMMDSDKSVFESDSDDVDTPFSYILDKVMDEVDTIDKIQADSYCDSLEKQLLEKDKDSYSNRFDPDYCDGEEFDDITPEEFQLYIPKVNEDNDEAEEDSAEYRRYYDFDNTFEDSNFNA